MIIGRISLSAGMVAKFGIPANKIINIRAGNIVTTAKLVITKSKKSTYMLSPELVTHLHLTKRNNLQLRYDANNNLIHIGPIIGILSSFLPNREKYDPTSIQAELIYLSKIGRTLPALIYIFTPESIDWQNMTTRGYYYHKNSGTQGIWVSSVYPLPDVVYNRIATRRIETRGTIKRTKSKLMNLPYLKYFNPSFLNKWKVHKLLYTNPELHTFLPETRLLNAANLSQMLQNHDKLYLKPCNGSLGKGIIKATINSQGNIKFIVYGTQKIRGTADNYSELLKKTYKYRKGKAYIVQQGLNLATYKKCPFDIRIIFQKNYHGEWQLTKKFVRVAPHGSSISNLSSGGRAERAHKIFKAIFKDPDQIETKNSQINNLCQLVASTLEKSSKLIYGELGLDIGIDQFGHPWLIEVNSKPRKSTKTNFSQVLVRNSFKRPLQYAIYLAGFYNS